MKGTPYQYNSGGDPIAIPKLTHDQLRDFHKKYHPSNTTFLSYGDLDFTKHIKEIEEFTLASFDKAQIDSQISKAERRPHSFNVTHKFQPELISDIDSQAIISFSTLCGNIAEDPYENFVLAILSQLLFDGPSSPFHEAFIESGFAPSFSPGNGYDHTTKEASFSIGVSHVDNKIDFKDVEDIIT